MSTETCPVCFADTDPVIGHECMAGWKAHRIAPTESFAWYGKYCLHCGRTNRYGDPCPCRKYAGAEQPTTSYTKVVLPGVEA